MVIGWDGLMGPAREPHWIRHVKYIFMYISQLSVKFGENLSMGVIIIIKLDNLEL